MKTWLFSSFIVLSFVVSAQNVGIGTPIPLTKLHITSATDEVLRIDAGNPFLSLYSSGVYKGYFWKAPNSIEVGSAAGSNLPVTFAPDGIQRMAISTNGNVGINTLNPSQKFHVEGISYLNGFVGIQNVNPNAPLSFAPALGKKITLYPGASGDVGMAVQASQLQIYADHPNADISFGYDQSGNFTERMRVKGNGDVGIGTSSPAGRLEVFSGNPTQLVISQSANDFSRINMRNINTGATTRSWDIAAYIDATSINNDRLNFFLAGGGNILSLNGNGRVGIGTADPTAPLGFPAIIGKKITLFPGTTGDAGFAIAADRLQIYTDNPNADVAIGYDANGIFNERFAVKSDGKLAIIGNTGLPGQVLVNNAAGIPQWGYNFPKVYFAFLPNFLFDWSINGGLEVSLPGLAVTVTITTPSTINISALVYGSIENCFGCGDQLRGFRVKRDGTGVYEFEEIDGGQNKNMVLPGFYEHLNPGTYTYRIDAFRATQNYRIKFYGGTSYPQQKSYMTIQVFPD